MIIDTEHLFFSLLKKLNVNLVFDIGSRDGLQSIQIRESLPNAVIIAFEASPDNYHYMIDNTELRAMNIEIYNLAISNYKGKTSFNIYKDDKYSNFEDERSKLSGLNSLYGRKDLELDRVIEIEVGRIDDYVIDNKYVDKNIALWIDVEGADYQVIEGIEKIKDSVSLVHVEVLTDKLYGSEQKTKKQIIGLMNSYNFEIIGISFEEKEGSFSFGNALFINKKFVVNKNINILYYRWKIYILQKIRKNMVHLIKNRFPFIYRRTKYLYQKYLLK